MTIWVTLLPQRLFEKLTKNGTSPIGAKVGILGLTFKENCPDLRNTKVVTIIKSLEQFHCDIIVSDSFAIDSEVKNQLDIDLVPFNRVKNLDAVIIAVKHSAYCNFKEQNWKVLLKPGGLIMDIKSIYNKDKLLLNEYSYWSL